MTGLMGLQSNQLTSLGNTAPSRAGGISGLFCWDIPRTYRSPGVFQVSKTIFSGFHNTGGPTSLLSVISGLGPPNAVARKPHSASVQDAKLWVLIKCDQIINIMSQLLDVDGYSMACSMPWYNTIWHQIESCCGFQPLAATLHCVPPVTQASRWSNLPLEAATV